MIKKSVLLFALIAVLACSSACGGNAAQENSDPAVAGIASPGPAQNTGIDWPDARPLYQELIMSRAWEQDCLSDAPFGLSAFEICCQKTVDLDADGTPEFFCVALMEDSYADSSGFAEMYSLLYTIRDAIPFCLFTSYMSSGSMGGGMLSSAINPADGSLLLCESWRTGGWGGVVRGKTYYSIKALQEGTLAPELSYSLCSQPAGLYEQEQSAEEDVYYRDEGGTVTVYRVNGKPAPIEEYCLADYFCPAAGEYYFSSGTALKGLKQEARNLYESSDAERRVQARLEDGMVTLVLDRQFWHEYLETELAEGCYRVTGLGEACSGVHVGTLGWQPAPMVLFLREDSRVEYLDIANALLKSHGIPGQLESNGVMPGLLGIVGFCPGSDDSPALFAVDHWGDRYDAYLSYVAGDWVGDWSAGRSADKGRLELEAGGRFEYQQYRPGKAIRGCWRLIQPGAGPAGLVVFRMSDGGRQESFGAVYELQVVDNTLYMQHISGDCFTAADVSGTPLEFNRVY